MGCSPQRCTFSLQADIRYGYSEGRKHSSSDQVRILNIIEHESCRNSYALDYPSRGGFVQGGRFLSGFLTQYVYIVVAYTIPTCARPTSNKNEQNRQRQSVEHRK